MALFINEGGSKKIRIGKPSDCYWATIRKGESVNLPKEIGIALGFKIKTTEGQIGNKVVETKQIEVPKKSNFFKELCSIKGIGSKTAKDIISIFPNSEELKTKIHNMEHLPFREDTCELLEEFYGN